MILRLIFALCAIGALVTSAPAQRAQESLVAPSLVYIKIHYTPTKGEYVGVPQEDQATGFFVSDDGFILTAYHLLDRMHEIGGEDTTAVSVSIGDPEKQAVTAAIVNGLAPLDLLLLKIRPDEPFTPLKLGTARTMEEGDPLYTSGFLGTQLLTKNGTLANKVGQLGIGYLWALNVQIPAGMSGSPVYLKDGTVVGLLKGQDKDDPSIGYMVPIEYADALIAHLRFRDIEREIALLKEEIGVWKDGDAPIAPRLAKVETNMRDVGANFDWSAERTPSGALVVTYRKLIADPPQIKSIDYQVIAYLTYQDGTTIRGKHAFLKETAPIHVHDDGQAGDATIENVTIPAAAVCQYDTDAVALPWIVVSIIPKLDNDTVLSPAPPIRVDLQMIKATAGPAPRPCKLTD
ncbi:exported hypothetical protein [Mesorhizobium plurifarium]|uniref:Serine protease n=1 Tax=Mesorhizobium plurifarium TaxID=69974 RepID=A0A090DWH7_MESPL|nr:exported hypothetical protein [Mesorhizobium plurifarium]